MTDRTKAILLSMPFVIAGLVVLFLPKMRDWQDAKVYQKLVEMPSWGVTSKKRKGLYSRLSIYIHGNNIRCTKRLHQTSRV